LRASRGSSELSGESRRIQRVEKELRHVVAGYLLTGLRGSFSCLISVTHVKVSPDLRHAKVYVSLMGDSKAKQADWLLLEKQVSEIQRHVGANLKLKFTPRLQLFLDSSADEVDKIQRILNDIKAGEMQLRPSVEGEDEG
jgi:ribosome-binding factor A